MCVCTYSENVNEITVNKRLKRYVRHLSNPTTIIGLRTPLFKNLLHFKLFYGLRYGFLFLFGFCIRIYIKLALFIK